VEVSAQGTVILVRSSTDPDGIRLAICQDEWRNWISKVREGFFDEV
jgi:hypothetical protein